MRDAYIVKKSVKRKILRPTEKIDFEDFGKLVDNTDQLKWYEETKHGKRFHARRPDLKKRMNAYLNTDENDLKSFVQFNYSQSGYITIYFEHKSTKANLHELIILAEQLDANLWQIKPKKQILTHEIVDDRYKRTKPIAKRQTDLIPINDWLTFDGDLNLFIKVFRIKTEQIKATISRINKFHTNKNSIAILRQGDNTYFVSGNGIAHMYETEFDREPVEQQKRKFHKSLNALFTNVHIKETSENKLVVENKIIAALNDSISSGANITIGKIQKRML